MPGLSREVVLGDLDRLKVLINKQSNKNIQFIFPKDVKNIQDRYLSLLKRKKRKYVSTYEVDEKAVSVIQKNSINLRDGMQPIM